MATKAELTVRTVNQHLSQTLGLVKDINQNRVRPGLARTERRLEEELKRRKLTTNEPE